MRFKKWKPPKMKHGKLTKWNWLPYYPENIKICQGVDIGAFTFLQGENGIYIGHYTQIGSHCSIFSEDTERGISGNIHIAPFTKIGAHSVILPKSNQTHIISGNIKAGSVVF